MNVAQYRENFDPPSWIKNKNNLNEDTNDSITTGIRRVLIMSVSRINYDGRREKYLLEYKGYGRKIGIVYPYIYNIDMMIYTGGEDYYESPVQHSKKDSGLW